MYVFFFFNDTATTEIYTLSLHDALPISDRHRADRLLGQYSPARVALPGACSITAPRWRHLPSTGHGRRIRRPKIAPSDPRSEEHTSELQSRQYLVCRLLLEKKKKSVQPR